MLEQLTATTTHPTSPTSVLEVEHTIAIARSLIQTEIAGIQQLVHCLDASFVAACQYLYCCAGHIIVMGIGKSGHIGKKIAATLASTGSPAFFIHPTEALHGDLGMMTKQDVLLMISHSGETADMLALLPAIQSWYLPLITMTSQPASTLAQAATININIGVAQEACPLGLAPTTSSTASLVMGDALAMVLLHRRGLSQHDFARLHPGGMLGKRLLLKVRHLMHTDNAMPIVTIDALLTTALIEMTSKQLGMTIVITATGEIAGILTDGDIRRAFEQGADAHATRITQCMSSTPKTIASHCLVMEALEKMETLKITTLIVSDDQLKPIGVIHIHDILRAGLAI